MKNWGIIKWLIEAVFRLSKRSPSFFNYLAWFGIALILVASVCYGLAAAHIKLPPLVAWLNDGFFVGLGSGLTVCAVLAVDKTQISEETIEKKMPVTAKNDIK